MNEDAETIEKYQLLFMAAAFFGILTVMLLMLALLTLFPPLGVAAMTTTVLAVATSIHGMTLYAIKVFKEHPDQ